MSGGLHRLWKDDLVAWLAPPKSARRFDLIDVAGGTGDITRRVLEAGGSGCRAVLCDINPAMVEVGRKRLAEAGLGGRVAFAIGNAEALPFPDKIVRRLHDRLRHPQRHAHRPGAGRGLPRAQDRRALPVPGVLGLRGAPARPPLRLPLLRDHSAPGRSWPPAPPSPTATSSRASASSPRRSRSPHMIRAAGFARVSLPQPHRRHRRDPLGLADLRSDGAYGSSSSPTPSSRIQPTQYMVHGRIVDPFENPEPRARR